MGRVDRLLREFEALPDEKFPLFSLSRRREEIEAEWQGLGSESVPALIDALQKKEYRKRYLAADKLAQIGDARAVDALIACLEDEDFVVRMWAVDALGKLRDRRSVNPIVRRLRDDAPGVRRSAAAALGFLGEPGAALPLIDALQDADMMTRVEAIRSLGRLGDFGSRNAIRELLERDRSDLIQEEGKRALAVIEKHG